METSRSIKEFFLVKRIKKEPHESSFHDEMCGNLDPQKYHYKDELNLDWDEKDNNYFGEQTRDSDKKNDVYKEKSVEKSEEKISEGSMNSILENSNFQPRKICVKVENSSIEKNNVSEDFGTQRHHYKEELNLDWDEKDNDYAINYGTIVENPVEEIKTHKLTKNKHNSVSKCSRSRKKNVKIENPDAEKECPRCKKRLKNQNTLVKHLFYCGKAPHLQCDSCTYKAKYKNALITHIIRNHPQQISNFKKNKTTQKKGIKKNMIPKEHQESDKYLRFCTNCNISIDKPKLNKCNKCESCLLYQCRLCTATFQSREKLTRHIIDKCDPKGYYHCPACDFKGTIKQSVKFHLTVHLVPGSHLDTETIKWKKVEKKDNDTPNLFTCPSCEKQFQRKASLANHMRYCIKSQGVKKPPTHYVEKKTSDFKNLISQCCSKCKNEVLTNQSLTNECCGSMMSYKCLKCHRTYERIVSMRYHVSSVCYPQTKYKCDLCDYEGIANNLARHRKRKHDCNSVECPKCKKKLKNKGTLRHHSYYCGKGPLKCDYCSHSYTRKHYLKEHILMKHLK